MRTVVDPTRCEAGRGEHDAAAPAAHGPVSSNPALELQAALRRARERERGRDRALRELEKRAGDPEWRSHDSEPEVPEAAEVPEGMMVMPVLEIKAASPRDAQMMRAQPAGVGTDDRTEPGDHGSPAASKLGRPTGDLRGIHPPHDRFLILHPAEAAPEAAGEEPGGETAIPDPPKPEPTPDGAASAARGNLAQNQPHTPHPHGHSQRPKATPPVKPPRPGELHKDLPSDDKRKVEEQAKRAEKALKDGPDAGGDKDQDKDKEKDKDKDKKPGKAATAALRDKDKPGQPPKPGAAGGGGGGGGGEAEAWGQRHAKKADKLEAQPVPDAERYVATYTEARSTAQGNSDKEHLELLESASKAVDPLKMPKDAPAYPQPDDFAEAHKLVTGKLNREIPDQDMPDLQPTPRGIQPEVGRSLVPGREGELGKVMQETRDASGKPISVEVKVVAADAKPQAKDDKTIQIKMPKPGGDLKKSLDGANKEGDKNKEGAAKAKNAGKGAKLSAEGDRPLGPPAVPAFAQVDVGTIVSKLLGHTKHYAGKIVEDARKGWASGKMKTGDVSKFIPGEVEPVTGELHKIATAAGISEAALNAKTKTEEQKLIKDVEEQNKEAEGEHTKTGVEIKRERSFLAGTIGDLRDGLDLMIDDKDAVAKGGFDPKEVRKKRDDAKADVDKLVVKWRGEYKRMGEARATQIKDAGTKQNDAYQAAAELDRQQIDLELGITSPAQRKADIAAKRSKRDKDKPWDNKFEKSEYEKTDNWLSQTLRELGVNLQDLTKFASDTADGYKTDITDAGESADKIIDDWAEARFNKERSWWKKILAAIRDWLTPAKQQAREWDTASTENNNTNLSKDMIWLETARLKHWTELSEETIKSSGGFSEEQKAMLLAMKSGGDSATALAAGLISRISQQRREGLSKQFETEVMTWNSPESVEEIGVGQGGQSAGFANMKAKTIYIAGVDQVGTNEKGMFDALTGLTKIQGRAVELKYTALYGRSMRDDMKGELYDWTQQLTGSTGDWDRAEALLEGNADKATAIELDQAMNETFGGLGFGTDSDAIFRLLKDKSPAQIAKIKQEYRRRYGRDLVTALDKELDDGWSTQHDVNRMYALMAGDKEKARAIEADQKMRGSVLFGLSTDKKGLEQVYKDINAEVAAEGERKGWDTERIQREIAKRYDVLDQKYETQYGADFTDRAKGDSALRTAMKDSFTWGSGKGAFNLTTSTGDLDLLLSYQNVGQHKDDKNIKAVFETQLAESNAARIQSEHRGIFSSSDSEINKALAEQYEDAYKNDLRDKKLELERTKDFEWDQLQDKLAAQFKDRREAAQKIKDPKEREAALKKITEDKKEEERDFKHRWAPQGGEYLKIIRDLKKDASASAQKTAEKNMDRLADTFDKKYQQWNYDNGVGFGGRPVHERQSFKDIVKGDTGWGIFGGTRTKENDKTIALLEGKGYLSGEDKLYFAVKGTGTDEDTSKEVFADADSVEAKEILAKLGKRLANEDKQGSAEGLSDDAAAANAKDCVMGDFSGREGQDQEIAMMGVPHTPDEYLAVAKRRKEMEQASGPSKYASSLPMLAPFGAALLLTPAAPLGGALLGASQLGGAMSSIDKESLGLIDDQIADLQAQKKLADDLWEKGRRPGDDDYDKVMDQVGVLGQRVQTAVELHRAQVDAATDVVTNIVTAVVMVVVTVVSIIAAPVTGGASAAAAFALWAAVIGSVAATVANIAVKMAMKGDAYGIEEIGYDAAVGIAEAIASGLTAGLGDKFLKMGFLAKMAGGGVIQRVAAHGLANAAEGMLQALPGALVGNILNDENYKNGNPFANVLFGTVAQVGMAGAMSGGMGGLLGGIKKPTGLITPGTHEYNELFHQYKLKNPSATHEQFRLDLHMKVMTGEHPALGKKQLEDVARSQVLAGLDKEIDKDAAKAFKKLKVEVVSPEEFTRITKSKALGEAAVMIRGGEPTILVKAGADFQNLHREAPHLLQSLREDTRKLMGKLDEAALVHWDKLPIDHKVDLYKTKLQLEIDAHQQMLKRLTPEEGIKRFGEAGYKKELAYTRQTLENLENRMAQVEHDLGKIKSGELRPHYLEEPPRLFTKDTKAAVPRPPPPEPAWMTKAKAEGKVHEDFQMSGGNPTVNKETLDKAHAAGYRIVPDKFDPKTPRLEPLEGFHPDPPMMLYSASVEQSNRKFKLAEMGNLEELPHGKQFTQTPYGFRMDTIDGLGEGAVKRSWAEQKGKLGQGFGNAQLETLPKFEAHLKALGVGTEDAAVLRRWGQSMEAYSDRLGDSQFLDGAFAKLKASLGESKELKEAMYEDFRKAFREDFGKRLAELEGPARQKLLHGFEDASGKKIVGLLDQFPEPASKGAFFREVAINDMKAKGKAHWISDELGEKFPLRHPIEAGTTGPTRDFDGALAIKQPIADNGPPPPGNRFFEFKAGKGALKDANQVFDEADFFAKGPRMVSVTEGGKTVSHEMKGNVMVFSQESEARAGLGLLEKGAKERVDKFVQVVEAERFHIGYYDANGKLQFFTQAEIIARVKPPTVPGGGVPPIPHLPSAPHVPPAPSGAAVKGASSHVTGSNVHGLDSPIWRPATSARGAVESAAKIPGVERLPAGRLKVTTAVGEIEVEVVAHQVSNLDDTLARHRGAAGVRDDKLTDVARFEYYPHNKQGAIYVSDRASALSIERSMHHEIAELREELSGVAGKTDVLRRGKLASGAVLSPHDAGRVAELEWLAGKLDGATPAMDAKLRHEVHALIEDLGLRKGFKDAEGRMALIESRLSPEARATLEPMRAPLRSLGSRDAAVVRDVRIARARDVLAGRELRNRPLRPMVGLKRPGDPEGALSRAALEIRAAEAQEVRRQAAEVTWSQLQRRQARGTLVPIDSPWIGGGAGLAGLGRGQLLVDPSGRWHIDLSDDIAQSAEQLAGVRAARLGDPAHAAAPSERVPLAAVRAWEDFRAAGGPVLEAHATLELGPGKTFEMRVDAGGGKTMTLPVEGTPVISTGFPREVAPGGVRFPENVTDSATLARLRAADERAELAWQQLERDNPGRVFRGDDSNARGFDATAAHDWLVVGTGGTGISAAEIIFGKNPGASVHMVGGEWTPGITTNPQFQAVSRHPHFSQEVGIRLEKIEPITPGAPGLKVTLRQTAPDGTVTFRTLTPGGVIVAIGGRNRAPAPIAHAIERVQAAGGRVTGSALRDHDGHYIGYRLTFPTGHEVDVTGAASRFAPNDVHFSSEDRKIMARALALDALPQSGNFSGGFAASALQAERYGQWRKRTRTP